MIDADPPAPYRVFREIHGNVQGVGFRPAVQRLATSLGLRGWVRNHPGGAEIFLTGTEEQLRLFWDRLPHALPPAAKIEHIHEYPDDAEEIPDGFEIRESSHMGAFSAGILSDLATCPVCLQEMNDPANRRYRYPFTNCTHCGPRYSILEALPYDRPNTVMREFQMCPDCQTEYDSPADRRFHAQPNACSVCGPQLAWVDGKGHTLAQQEAALQAAGEAIQSGAIVALKGIGGFQLLVDARNEAAVCRLRQRKCREGKPFAVMFPSMDSLSRHCRLEAGAAEALASPTAPILLLEKQDADGLAESVAPGLHQLGAFLPYSPLHHLLLQDLSFPVVATSGNRSEEPICHGNEKALARLAGIADFFLMHDRRIVRPMDDSVCLLFRGNLLPIRRGRGMAPYRLPLPDAPPGLLGVGGDRKSTIGLADGRHITLSAHLGDLTHPLAVSLWRRTLSDLEMLRGTPVSRVAADAHPDYISTREAEKIGVPVLRVQHHHAHAMASVAAHDETGKTLCLVWDGAGWGSDGTSWGGEFFVFEENQLERVGALLPFSLLGGDAAANDPRRIAFALQCEADMPPLEMDFTPAEQTLLFSMWKNKIHALQTTSMGRLFDGVSAMVGACRRKIGYEGEAAMRLEALAENPDASAYPFAWDGLHLDWREMIREIMRQGETPGRIASRFHATLGEVALSAARRFQCPTVAVSGGCFQNKRLLTAVVTRLEQNGFRVLLPEEVPCNDAGLAYGQAVWAAHFARA